MSGVAEMLTIARWLFHERGFSVIPLDHPADTTQTDPKRIGKVPVLSPWKAAALARVLVAAHLAAHTSTTTQAEAAR